MSGQILDLKPASARAHLPVRERADGEPTGPVVAWVSRFGFDADRDVVREPAGSTSPSCRRENAMPH